MPARLQAVSFLSGCESKVIASGNAGAREHAATTAPATRHAEPRSFEGTLAAKCILEAPSRMPDQSDNLTFELRRKLDAGTPAEDVVRELMARGMSRTTASRFVDRANADRLAAPAWVAPERPPRLSPRARRLVWTAVTCLALAGTAGPLGWREMQRRREAEAAAAAELAAADTSRADQARGDSAVEREASNRERAARLDARLERALKDLTSDRPTTQCDAALLIGRLGNKAHVDALVGVLSSPRASSARNCAASALVSLGETAMA